VTLVEASPRPERQFRGEALMPSGLEALDQLGLADLPKGTIPQRPLAGWSFNVHGQPLFQVPEPLGGPPPCRLLDQGALLAHWLQLAQQEPTLQLLRGVAVRELLWQPTAGPEPRVGGVVLADGRRLEAALVIGCDGRSSLVRQQAALPFQEAPATLEVLWFRLAAAASEAMAPLLGGQFHTAIGPEGTLALYERARGGIQVGWALAAGERPEASRQEWRRRLAANGPAALAPLWATVPLEALEGPLRLPVRVGMAQAWHRPGVLLLGDAAHPMSPVRAQGINMALRDSYVAAQELVAADGPAALDAAALRVQRRRLPEIQRMQALQSAEARQGALLGHSALLRQGALAAAPLAGPLAETLWRRRQRPLREGLAGALSARTASPGRWAE